MMKEMIHEGIYDMQILLGALFHDILEDTDLSYAQFQDIFSHPLFDIVYGLSNLDHNKQKMPKPDYFLRFASAIQIEWRIMFIKIFDCFDNLRTIDDLTTER